MKLYFLIITRKQRNWKKFQTFRDATAFPELYFSFPAVLGAITQLERQRIGLYSLQAPSASRRLEFLHCVFIPPGKVSPARFFCFGDVYFPYLSSCSWNCSLPDPCTSSAGSAQILSTPGVFQTPDRRVKMFILFSRSLSLQFRAFQDKLTQS